MVLHRRDCALGHPVDTFRTVRAERQSNLRDAGQQLVHFFERDANEMTLHKLLCCEIGERAGGHEEALLSCGVLLVVVFDGRLVELEYLGPLVFFVLLCRVE